MPILPCPACDRDVLTTGGCCSHCGTKLEARAAPAAPAAVPQSKGPRLVNQTCPRCRGTGKLRDRSLLPWNNIASLLVILGVTGLIGAAYMDENRKAVLLGGVVSSIIGIGLYIVGEPCPRCKGNGEFLALKRPKRAVDRKPNYVGVADDAPPPPSGVTRVKLGRDATRGRR
jgi:hypothetical protein